MSFRKLTSLIFTILCALQLLCTQSSSVVMTGGSEVVGTMVDKDGKPVQGAVVRLDTMITTADTSFDSIAFAVTDNQGSFKIKRDHGGGIYSIYGNYKNQTLVVLVRGIKDPNTDTVFHEINVGRCVMLAPGFIKGKIVKYSAPDSMEGTYCYIPGTSISATTDDSGKFVMSGLAPDTYSVYFSAQSYLPLRLYTIVVHSSDTADIGIDSLSLDPNQPLGPPRSLHAFLDTAQGSVTVSWSKLPVNDLQGYIVSHGKIGNAFRFDTISKNDTIFFDTLYRDLNDTSRFAAQYSVAGFDNADRGLFSQPVSMQIVPPYNARTIFKFSIAATSSDTIVAGDSVSVIVHFVNNRYSNKKLVWYVQDTGRAPLKTVIALQQAGLDTLKTVFQHDGNSTILVKALDERGMSWVDSLAVHTRPHPVDLIRSDSTLSSLTLYWQKSNSQEFSSYRVFKRIQLKDSLINTISVRTDTVQTISTYKTGPAQYFVIVADSQNNVSRPGKICTAWIKNSPPVFTIDSTTLPRTVSINSRMKISLLAHDINGDSISFSASSSYGTISGDSFVWTPSQIDTGSKRIVFYVSDPLGAKDSLRWNVVVTTSGFMSYADSMAVPRFSVAATMVNDVLYVAGGTQYISQSGAMQPYSMSAVEKKSLSVNSVWTKSISLSVPRSDFGMASNGNTIVVLGGAQVVGQFKPAINANSIDTISPTGQTWQTAYTMASPLIGNAVCSIGNKIYSIGGMTSSTNVSNKILEYDLSTGVLKTVVYLNSSRTYSQAVASGGKIYIMGGWGGAATLEQGSALSSMEVFNPATNAIETAVDSLKIARYYAPPL